MTASPMTARGSWSLAEADCRLDDFEAVVEQATALDDYPHASRVEQNALVYNSSRLHRDILTAEGRNSVQAELVSALMGHNRSTDIKRMPNLLQVSSAFGRAMESIDREKICNAVYPALLAMKQRGAPDDAVQNAVAAAAEGYAFPTNLDRDQPVGGLPPQTQAELVWRAVTENWEAAALGDELAAYADRRRTEEV
jgi:hypothetical protein